MVDVSGKDSHEAGGDGAGNDYNAAGDISE